MPFPWHVYATFFLPDHMAHRFWRFFLFFILEYIWIKIRPTSIVSLACEWHRYVQCVNNVPSQFDPTDWHKCRVKKETYHQMYIAHTQRWRWHPRWENPYPTILNRGVHIPVERTSIRYYTFFSRSKTLANSPHERTFQMTIAQSPSRPFSQ